MARVVEETVDACSFVIEIPDDKKELFAYLAGQYLTFRISYEGRELVRCYSLASSPVCDDEHKVTVKRGDNRIVIVYRDRSQERAMDIMGAMRIEYLYLRQRKVEEGELPPLSRDQSR